MTMTMLKILDNEDDDSDDDNDKSVFGDASLS